MTTLRLSESPPVVIMFDGQVLEIFQDPYQLNYRRHGLHIYWINMMRIVDDGKGEHSLIIHTIENREFGKCTIDENVIQKVNNLIAEVKQAKTDFKFD